MKIFCLLIEIHIISNDKNVFNVLNRLRPIWLIVDHYNLDIRFEKRAKNFCQKILIVDDLANRYHHCDILLDHGPSRVPEDYSKWVNGDCQLFLGSEYAIVGEEFKRFRKKVIKNWEKGLISFGGADINNIALKILQELEKQYLFSGIKWTVLTGIINPHWDVIKHFTKQSKMNITLIKHTDEVARVLFEHDFAIGAAGGMTWERACIGIPSLVIPIANNQSHGIEAINKFEIGETLDLDELTLHTITSSLKLLEENAQLIMHRSQSLVDGLGVVRLVNVLIRTC